MHLPDEILSLILSPALTVPDRDFASTDSLSPFATYSESASAYLLVSKSWLRVATPLLYHVVVVRSKAQAATLARALLQKDLNLGRYVKKLRIEGAYGAPLLAVFKNIPNLTDLCLSLTIYSADNVVGLCAGLPLVNPTRLIVQRPDGRSNKNKTALMGALVASIASWTHLTVFDASAFRAIDLETSLLPLFQALSTAQRLTTVVVSNIRMVDPVYDLLKGCPLALIRPIRQLRLSVDLGIQNQIARTLVKFEDEEKPAHRGSRTSFRTSGPRSSPTACTSLFSPNRTVPDSVFRVILRFAMTDIDGPRNSTSRERPSRLPFLLVSKRFFRLGIVPFYTETQLSSISNMEAFDELLLKYPYLRPEVRSLAVRQLWPSAVFNSHVHLLPGHQEKPRFQAYLARILSKLPALLNLELGSGQMVCHWAGLVLAANVAQRLRSISVYLEEAQNLNAGDAFNHLGQCRSLFWRSQATFDAAQPISADALINLEELNVAYSHNSLTDILAGANLPALKRVVFMDFLDHTGSKYTPFLRAHGPKLHSLEIPASQLSGLLDCLFDTCPVLESLVITWHTSGPLGLPSNFFSPSTACANLNKLRLIVDLPRKLKATDALAREWETLFGCLAATQAATRFPNLHEIQMTGCSWPKNRIALADLGLHRRDIAKNLFVRWAELLLKRDVRLVDRSGKGWRPRLSL
ncbi:F-box domain-containing protein [Mycena chlorophos]|uniref:F-box domain-containing protein n=1 Tax=Mycena chlorophos TaxID=658473 RepID=A0A8H6SBU9_MYCCL|nr:F-box domain-containing protein [Mycena chlorophos]